MRKIRVILFGVGAIGSLIAKFLLEKEGVEIVGAVDIAKDKVGKDLGEIIRVQKNLGIKVAQHADEILSRVKADLAIHTTSSFLKETYSQITSLMKHGVKIISTCEELTYPYYTEPKLARKLDALAKKYNITVLGTGINPGFLMDTLVITLTTVCQRIEKIEAVRVMDAAKRRLPFQMKIGAGLTKRDFKQKMESEQNIGHVGLEQSIAMIADALAWKLDKIVAEQAEPIIAEKPIESQFAKVKAGEVAGLKQKAKGIMKNREAITLEFQACVGAEEEYDAITIFGVPDVKQKIQPCVHGDIGTVAIVANAIPKVIKAPPGLLTMKDLPLPSAATEDMRKYIRAFNN